MNKDIHSNAFVTIGCCVKAYLVQLFICRHLVIDDDIPVSDHAGRKYIVVQIPPYYVPFRLWVFLFDTVPVLRGREKLIQFLIVQVPGTGKPVSNSFPYNISANVGRQ